MTCVKFLSFIILVSAHCSVRFCLGILPVNILYFNQPYPLYYSSHPFPLTLYWSTVFSAFHCLDPTQMMYFNITPSLLFFSLFPRPSLL
jgi:hypothetical protein